MTLYTSEMPPIQIKPAHRSRWTNNRTYRVAIVWRDDLTKTTVFYRYEDHWLEAHGVINDMYGSFYELPLARFYALFTPEVALGAGRVPISDETLQRQLGAEYFPLVITRSTPEVTRYRHRKAVAR